MPENAVAAPWRLRFWSVFVGQAISLLGSALTQFVLLWWITDTTGSITSLAVAGMVALLPQAILSPIGGVFADRYSRRIIMCTADAVSAACMLALIVLFSLDKAELWHVYSLMFVRSAMQAFQAPAATASMAMLVPLDYLPRAAGLNQAMQSMTTVAAAPLGALAIGLLSYEHAFAIDIVTALMGIAPLLIFRIPQVRGRVEQGVSGVWRQFKEGLSLVWNDPGLVRLYALMAAVVLMVMPSFTLVPLLVKEHFSGAAPEVALMEGLAGVGMVVGGMIVAAFAPKRKIKWVIWGFAASCGSLALTGMAPSNLFGVAIAWWVISGLAFVLGNAPMTALLQTIVPNQMQGRVLSILNMCMGLAAPIGLAIATPMGELIGARWLFVLMGTLGAVVSLLGLLSSKLLSLGSELGTQRLEKP
ncbi:MFS transporter [Pseudoxanthomonas mexicana]